MMKEKRQAFLKCNSKTWIGATSWISHQDVLTRRNRVTVWENKKKWPTLLTGLSTCSFVSNWFTIFIETITISCRATTINKMARGSHLQLRAWIGHTSSSYTDSSIWQCHEQSIQQNDVRNVADEEIRHQRWPSHCNEMTYSSQVIRRRQKSRVNATDLTSRIRQRQHLKNISIFS